MPAGNEVEFADVFAHRDWILQTMGKTDYFLAGNTRLRFDGESPPGEMILNCFTPDVKGSWMSGPLHVLGVEVGANCEYDRAQRVIFLLREQQTKGLRFGLRCTMKTTLGDGSVDVKALPSDPDGGETTYYGDLPYGAYREFICRIGMAGGPENAPTRG